jgi:hypothetical protein
MKFTAIRFSGLALLALSLVSILAVELILAPETGDSASTGTPQLAKTDSAASTSRVFMVIVDGWRYQSAIDSSLMPQVHQLKKQSAHGRMETVFEGFSYPAFKAIFEGREDSRLLNAVYNFFDKPAPSPSIFSDMLARGEPVYGFGYVHLDNFGPGIRLISPTHGSLDMFEADQRLPAIAMHAFDTTKSRFVILHFESLDWTGHDKRPPSDEYKAMLLKVDSLIAQLAARRAPGDYLVVMGDHGSDERGQHKTGLDIPTYGLFMGPVFKPGAEFEPLSIRNTRLMLSAALGIPIERGVYERERLQPVMTVPVQGINDTVQQAFPAWKLAVLISGAVAIALVLLILISTLRETAGGTKPAVIFGTLFVVELIVQLSGASVFPIFPLLILGGLFVEIKNISVIKTVLAVISIYFSISLFGFFEVPGLPMTRFSFPHIVALYAAGILSKLYVFGTFSKKRSAIATGVLLTVITTLTGLQLFDELWHKLLSAMVIGLGLTVFRKSPLRNALHAGFWYALFQYFFDIPIYQLVWTELFMAMLVLVRRSFSEQSSVWIGASGVAACAFYLIPGGFEWGFLFSMFPISVVQFNVGLFMPLILLKFPVLLFLTAGLLNVPVHRFALPVVVLTGIRIVAIFAVSVLPAGNLYRWHAGEQAVYFSLMLVAALLPLLFRKEKERGTAV